MMALQNGQGGNGNPGFGPTTYLGGTGGVNLGANASGLLGGAGGIGTVNGIPNASANSGTPGSDASSPNGGAGGAGGSAAFNSIALTGMLTFDRVLVQGGDGGQGGAVPEGRGGNGGTADFDVNSDLWVRTLEVKNGTSGTVGSAPGAGGGAHSAIRRLHVSDGLGTLIDAESYAVTISFLHFDPDSTVITTMTNISLSAVILVPPATAADGATPFQIQGPASLAFSSPLSVDPSNLNLAIGESITLLRSQSTLPPPWNNMLYSGYQTSINGNSLMLTNISAMPPAPIIRAASALPKTGDSFPLPWVLTGAGAALAAALWLGLGLRGKKTKG